MTPKHKPPIGIPDKRKPKGRPKKCAKEKNLLNYYKIQINLQDMVGYHFSAVVVKLEILKVDVKIYRSF